MASNRGRPNGGAGNGNPTKPGSELPPPNTLPGEPGWLLQAVMGLRGSVGELSGTVSGLVRSVEDQSRKLDGLTSKLDGLTREVDTLNGGIKLGRWVVGTLIALLGLLLTAISVALWKLPAIIEALRG